MEKGFLFFDDWEKPFRKLSGDEFKEMFWAMFDYQRKGEEPPEFEGALSLIADFVFPQLYRRAQNQIKGRENIRKRWENANGNLKATYSVTNSTLIHKDKDKDKDIDKDIDKPPTAPQGGAEGFEEFWDSYPRKDAKAQARKAWDKLKPDEEQRGRITSAVNAQRYSEQWSRDGGKFIPYASTWLNQRRWEDEVQMTRKTENSSFDTDEFFAAALKKSEIEMQEANERAQRESKG